MKINDVLTEAVYGWDDIKTAAKGFAQAIQSGKSWDDAVNSMMKDRYVRILATQARNQWKRIVDDQYRAYGAKLERGAAAKDQENQQRAAQGKPPSQARPKSEQAMRDILKRMLIDLVHNKLLASTGEKEITGTDTEKGLIDIILDNTMNSSAKLNSNETLDAFTYIVANGIATAQREAAIGKKGKTATRRKQPKAENPRDYGQSLDNYGEVANLANPDMPEYYEYAILPVQRIDIRYYDDNGEVLDLTRYIKVDGEWWEDTNNRGERVELDGMADILTEKELRKIMDYYDPSTGQLDWQPENAQVNVQAKAAMQRDYNSQTDFDLLTPNALQYWAKDTGRAL
jgi:hypothetical protein